MDDVAIILPRRKNCHEIHIHGDIRARGDKLGAAPALVVYERLHSLPHYIIDKGLVQISIALQHLKTKGVFKTVEARYG